MTDSLQHQVAWSTIAQTRVANWLVEGHYFGHHERSCSVTAVAIMGQAFEFAVHRMKEVDRWSGNEIPYLNRPPSDNTWSTLVQWRKRVRQRCQSYVHVVTRKSMSTRSAAPMDVLIAHVYCFTDAHPSHGRLPCENGRVQVDAHVCKMMHGARRRPTASSSFQGQTSTLRRSEFPKFQVHNVEMFDESESRKQASATPVDHWEKNECNRADTEICLSCWRRQSGWRDWPPHERVQQRTAEQLVEQPQYEEETVEMVRLVPQVRVQWTDEQTVRETRKRVWLGYMS